MILLLAAVLNIRAKTWINSPPLTDADVQGHVVLIDFWATWCLPCVMSLPTLQSYSDTFKEKPFTIIGVHYKSPGIRILPYLRDHNVRYPIAIDDGTTWRRYAVTVFPTYFL